MVLTSNRTREVHDALKRRCLYQWIDYPSFDKELAIVRAHAPQASARLAERVTAMVQEMRTADLYKKPGVSETIDWVTALVALDRDTEVIEQRREEAEAAVALAAPTAFAPPAEADPAEEFDTLMVDMPESRD